MIQECALAVVSMHDDWHRQMHSCWCGLHRFAYRTMLDAIKVMRFLFTRTPLLNIVTLLILASIVLEFVTSVQEHVDAALEPFGGWGPIVAVAALMDLYADARDQSRASR